VKKWAQDIDILNTDLIFVPINHDQNHWVLVVVNVVDHQVEYYDPYHNPDTHGYAANIRKWFAAECDQRSQCQPVLAHWQPITWAMPIDLVAPKQYNAYDCGMFVLLYAQCRAIDYKLGSAPAPFCQQDMPLLRKQVALAMIRFGSTLGDEEHRRSKRSKR